MAYIRLGATLFLIALGNYVFSEWLLQSWTCSLMKGQRPDWECGFLPFLLGLAGIAIIAAEGWISSRKLPWPVWLTLVLPVYRIIERSGMRQLPYFLIPLFITTVLATLLFWFSHFLNKSRTN